MTKERDGLGDSRQPVSLMSKTQLISLLHLGQSRAYRLAHFTPQTYRTIAETMGFLHMEREMPEWIDEWRTPVLHERSSLSPSARRSSRELVT